MGFGVWACNGNDPRGDTQPRSPSMPVWRGPASSSVVRGVTTPVPPHPALRRRIRRHSSASTAPLGISQYGLYVGSTTSTRPRHRNAATEAAIRLRANVAV